ncbi:MAG TPA: hypothetical protein PLL37_07135, partial [Bacillota bacterium]|nr:hypothetical protein [Bacillota bacterium]
SKGYMASEPLTADRPISQVPMQLAVHTEHIPEKSEICSGVLIFVLVKELPKDGLYDIENPP